MAGDAYEGSLYHRRRIASGLSEGEFEKQFTAEITDFYGKLPADRYKLIAKHVASLAEGGGKERFAFGLDMLIRSLATYVPKRR